MEPQYNTIQYNTIQYNECRYTKYNVGDIDFGGIDSDFNTKNTVIQYNYSHDNDGGFLITGGPNSKTFNNETIVRYNVFANEALVDYESSSGRINNLFRISGKISNTFVHNNLFYISEKINNRAIIYHKIWGNYPDKTTYFNNVIINNGCDNYIELTQSADTKFINNGFDGNAIISLPTQQNALMGNLKINWHGADQFDFDDISPIIDAGIPLIKMPDKDYYDNPISNKYNIGISQ